MQVKTQVPVNGRFISSELYPKRAMLRKESHGMPSTKLNGHHQIDTLLSSHTLCKLYSAPVISRLIQTFQFIDISICHRASRVKVG